MSPSEIRRKILQALYKCHETEAFCPVKSSALLNIIGLEDEAALFDSLQYLHDEGFIEGIFAAYLPQGYFESARITAKGIDLLNDTARLDSLLPADEASRSLEEFIERLRAAIRGLDIPGDEKDDALERLNAFVSDPSISKALKRVFS